MNIPDGVCNTFVLVESFYCTKAATTKDIQHHPQITAWQKTLLKSLGTGVSVHNKRSTKHLWQTSSGSGFYSPLSEVRLALFDTKLNVFICPSQKLQQRRKYIGSGSIKAANQPLGRLATQHLGRLPRFAIFNTWEYPALARLNASHIW